MRPSTRPEWARRILSVGVTGTNGKTTTTTWIARALATRAETGPVLCSTTLGVSIGGRPMAAERSFAGFRRAMRACLWAGGRAAAVELTSKALARGFAAAWPMDIAVFTNLSHDHLCDHGTFEHYLASKAQLFVHLRHGGAAVLNLADPSHELLRQVIPSGIECWSYGVQGRGESFRRADLWADRVCVRPTGTRFRLGGRRIGEPREIEIASHGRVQVENCLAALAASLAAGRELDATIEALVGARAPRGRFERVPGRARVIVDYAHGPDALATSLDTCRRLVGDAGRVHLVFGAGGERDRSKRAPMADAARSADTIVVTNDNPRGEDPRCIAAELELGLRGHPALEVELDRRRAIETTIARTGPRDIVLVAGKGHEDGQEIGGTLVPHDDFEIARAANA